MGFPKQWNSYQSTWSWLCFGTPTAKLGHQYVWFCTVWSDCVKGLFLIKLQNTGLVIYVSLNYKVAIVLYFVLQKILTHVKQLFQSDPTFCNCSQFLFVIIKEHYVIQAISKVHWQSCLNRLQFLSLKQNSVL